MANIPLASRQRQNFISEVGAQAQFVLDQLDHQTRNVPEDGQAAGAKEGHIAVALEVIIKDVTFTCKVLYTYDFRIVLWKHFEWGMKA